MKVLAKIKKGLVWTAVFSLFIQASFLSVLFTPQKASASALPLSIPITIQPDGATGKDSFTNQHQPGTNKGDETFLKVNATSASSGDNAKDKQTFIEFDLLDGLEDVPENATIASASLMLYLYDRPGANRTYGAHLVNTPWTESEITWNNPPAVSAVASDTVNMPTGSVPDSFISWDVKNDIINMMENPSTNNGWAIKDQNELSNGGESEFYSSDFGTASKRPKLVIEYVEVAATLSDTPNNPTNVTSTDITVGGTGVTAYKHSLDSSAYSVETLVSTKITESSLLEGDHTLKVIGKDASGNWQKEAYATEFTWTIDLTPPVITVDEQLTNDTTPTIGGGIDDANATISVNVNGIDYAGTNSGDGNWSADITESLSDDTYEVAATAKDSVDNEGTDETTDELTIDTEKPVTSYDISGGGTKRNGWYHKNTPPTIELTTEAGATIFWRWEGDAFSSGESPQNPIVTDGARTLEFYSVDAATNEETPHQTKTVKYDTTAPTAVLNDLPANPTNETSIDIEVEGDQVVKYRYSIDGGSYSGRKPISEHIELSGLSEGEHTIKVRGRDEAGNMQKIEDATEYTWTIDLTAPTTTFSTDPATPNGLSGWFKGAVPTIVLDAQSDEEIFWKWSTDSEYTESGTNYLEINMLEGINTIMFYSVDNATNIESPVQEEEVKYDAEAPTTTYEISPTDPNGNGGWYNGGSAPAITLSTEEGATIYWRWGTDEFTSTGTPTVSEGINTLDFYSVDQAGNQEETQSQEVKYDGTNPGAPTSEPGEGTYLSDTEVSLSNKEEATLTVLNNIIVDPFTDEIYYTLDGTDPTLENGSKYETSFVLTETTTVKAITIDQAGNESEIYTALYEILAPEITGETATVATETTMTITWSTVGHPSTSRVIYDISSHPESTVGPNYGYTFSTTEDSAKVESHSVLVAGLVPGTTYYFRTVSHGSPESVSKEFSKQTARTVIPVISTVLGSTSETIALNDSISQDVTPTVETPVAEEIKGDDTTETQKEEVKGESTEEIKGFWSKFGWLIGLGLIGLFIIFFAWKRRNEEE